MSMILLSAIGEKLLSDTRNFVSRRRKILIITGSVILAVLLGVWVKGWFKPGAPDPTKMGLGPLVKTDENGDKWQLDLVGGQPLDAIAASGVDPGPPLVVKADVRRNGSLATIGVVVVGQAGEEYVAGVRKNDEWQAAPKIRIVDQAGRVLWADKLEYG